MSLRTTAGAELAVTGHWGERESARTDRSELGTDHPSARLDWQRYLAALLPPPMTWPFHGGDGRRQKLCAFCNLPGVAHYSEDYRLEYAGQALGPFGAVVVAMKTSKVA